MMWSKPLPRANRPFHVMVKPVGPRCNLNCAYCFYLEKEAFMEVRDSCRMTEETLEAFTRNYLESQPQKEVTFAWQGGEPTLMGLPFYEKALEFQAKYGKGHKINNAFQTNGLLLDDKWGAFLKKSNFLVGISIDGPRKLHDAYRKHRNGKGSFDEVMRGIEVLKRHGVEWNTLTCINRLNAEKPLDVYRFLRGIGSRYMQFIPVVERKPNHLATEQGLKLQEPPRLDQENDQWVTPWSVQPKAFGAFLCAIYERWIRNDVGKYYIQHFDTALSKWLGMPGGICVHDEQCGNALAMEHDGSVYACDHYVYPAFLRGNANTNSFSEMLEGVPQKTFGGNKRALLPRYCRECPMLFACNGGCCKHRFRQSPAGEPGLNYLCEGYFQFFRYIDTTMRTMADLYRNGQPPSTIITLLKQGKVRLPRFEGTSRN